MWYTKYIESDGTDVSFRKEEKSLEKEDIRVKNKVDFWTHLYKGS